MKLFSAKKKEKSDNYCVQTALSQKSTHPFSFIDDYSPFAQKQFELYKALREAVPVVDAAITKLVRLVGSFEVECEDKRANKLLSSFLRNVKVNNSSQGVYQFISTYFEQLLTFGTSIGEIVLSKGGEITALYNADLKNIELKRAENIIDTLICVKEIDGNITIAPRQDLIMLSTLNPTPGALYGTSVLNGLPFVSSVLLKIFNTIGVNFERVGNVRFAVTYKPSDNMHSSSKQKVKEIADAWSTAMRNKNNVSDFVTVGDVSIKAIGADNQVLSCDVEIRHLLEQIVSKLSIPPFLLGLCWSSTERMSTVQADILTSEIEYYRSILNPVIERICAYYLRLQGIDCGLKICWNNINLLDETELAKARLSNAQAQQIELMTAEVKN